MYVLGYVRSLVLPRLFNCRGRSQTKKLCPKLRTCPKKAFRKMRTSKSLSISKRMCSSNDSNLGFSNNSDFAVALIGEMVQERQLTNSETISYNQGCGNGTQNSGSSSRHLNFLAPVPEHFGPLKSKNHYIICTTLLHHKPCLWNRYPNFRIQLQHLKIFGSGSSHPKLLGLRLHSPACNIISTEKQLNVESFRRLQPST